ncbi:unnamed protein product [Adineta steineri]|uniref:F-box domain-containing protein n=1 Tax=Adineta steineri TaxID=433720 RepID=A0A819BU18_9BILA|nr:unnamed protein product [Adineta steineri]CAF3803643.1 unnamed protein product [Adineta steineri]
MTTQFESLSNEILFNIFEHISLLDFFRIFYSINIRFNNLILDRYQNYSLDFRSLRKKDLYTICHDYLPLIINQIIYLRLSDDDDTPKQSIDFLSYNIKLHQFKTLRSLTFFHIIFDLKMEEFLFHDIHQLSCLTHLKFVDCRIESNYNRHDTKSYNFIDQIWSHEKLIYCYLEHYFILPTVISSSIQYLYIKRGGWEYKNLITLMEKTPNLQYFSTLVTFSTACDSSDEIDKTPPSSMNFSMKELKLIGISSPKLMINTLFRMPNLVHLNIESSFIYFDGNQWKDIIQNNLPKLKIFHLNMTYEYKNLKNKENQVDTILDTYRNSFWIDEHQWFMGCLWDNTKDSSWICLHSLPFSFRNYFEPKSQNNYRTKWINSSSNMKYSYNNIAYLNYNRSLFRKKNFLNMKFSNLQYLDIKLPYDNHLFLTCSKFDNLIVLRLNLSYNYSLFKLQALLDKLSRLITLEFQSWLTTEEIPPFNLTSKSVRRLNLIGRNELKQFHCFNRQQSIKLSKSPLGIQCQVLHIEVNDVLAIPELAFKMFNLRTLHVRYDKDPRNQRPELIDWLQYHLPSTMIVRQRCYGEYIIQPKTY